MNDMLKYYDYFDEWGRLDREPIEFLINMQVIGSHIPAGGRILDNGAGSGKYAMALAQAGYRVTLTDLSARLVEDAERRIETCEWRDRVEGCHVADAQDLSLFADASFDATLMMGPMYHLQREAEREKAALQLRRVTKPGGVVFVAFMSREKQAATYLLDPDRWPPCDTYAGIRAFLDTGVFNHRDEGRFTGAYAFPLAGIVPFMERMGFETLKLIASESIGGMTAEKLEAWRACGDAEYRDIVDLLVELAENPSILGASPHLLYVGKVPEF
ncbi:Methyltransferase domain-containing protein [Cohnella sp. OV330]|nr:class I SAM-dependent methyltransferase [Cohnella sp. OV330]SFA96430.1 Methyltransferase domain-containing protein [Cohnella sp. OV330]